MSMDASAAHYSTPGRVVHTRHPLFWIILIGLRPVRKEFKRIEMMLGSVNKVNGKFRLETEVTKVDRWTLLSLDNPKYAEVINKYAHLTGVRMIDGKKG